MKSDRWNEVESIVATALDLPKKERGAFLAEICGADDELRAEAEELLAGTAGAADFLEGATAKPTGNRSSSRLPDTDVVELDDALTRLEAMEPEKARVVELKFFGGLTNDELAEVLGCSEKTVRRHWKVAKLWLYRELTGAAHNAL